MSIDPDEGTGRCTCEFCTKQGYWSARAKPPQSFKVVSGEDNLRDYSKSDYGHHLFCPTCGVRTHTRGTLPEHGGEYISVNVRTLDEDLSVFEGKPVRYVDGRTNTWELLKTEPFHNPVPKSKGPSRAYGQMPQG